MWPGKSNNGPTSKDRISRSDTETKIKIFKRATALITQSLDLHQDGSVMFVDLNDCIDSAMTGTCITMDQGDTVHSVLCTQATSCMAGLGGAKSTCISFGHHNKPDGANSLDSDFLQTLSQKHPRGCLWNLELLTCHSAGSNSARAADKAYSTLYSGSESEQEQRQILQRIRTTFPEAHQVMFAVLPDTTSMQPSHCLFVISTNKQCHFDAVVDVSFLHAFCATIANDVGRMEAILSDKQKGDFVGTISHELRSPLHGVLASTEFLSESKLTGFQRSMVDMMAKCGQTLLDTMNHVLDYSKINAFEKQWTTSQKRAFDYPLFMNSDVIPTSIRSTAPPLLQISAITDISAILEEVVDGLLLGQIYNKHTDITDVSRRARGTIRQHQSGSSPDPSQISLPQIILDIENVDWSFMTQPGAIRRIIMNLAGNALKYTPKGTIDISLSLKVAMEDHVTDQMMLTVTDTGQGISPNFLASKLFIPFSQENSLYSGTGLGLSIVHSIVTMLGGDIKLHSTIGKGTTVKVRIPLRRPQAGQVSTLSTPSSIQHATSAAPPPRDTISALQSHHHGVSVSLGDVLASSNTNPSRSALGTYVVDWFQMKLVDLQESAHVTILEADELISCIKDINIETAIIVLYQAQNSHRISKLHDVVLQDRSVVEFVTFPCGPHKLAKALYTVLEKQAIATRLGAQASSSSVTAEPCSLQISSSVKHADCTEDIQSTHPAEVVSSSSSEVVSMAGNFATNAHDGLVQAAYLTPGTAAWSSDSDSRTRTKNAFPFPDQDEAHGTDPQMNLSSSNTSCPVEPGDASKTRQTLLPVRTPRVLIVDDNPINLKLLETYLRKKRQYDSLEKAANGLQAVNAFTAAAASCVPFDLVFMDISMPIMNGFEATRKIRQYEDDHRWQKDDSSTQTSALIVALTGLASGKDQAEGFACGVDIYMAKPMSFKEASRLLDDWESHRYESKERY